MIFFSFSFHFLSQQCGAYRQPQIFVDDNAFINRKSGIWEFMAILLLLLLLRLMMKKCWFSFLSFSSVTSTIPLPASINAKLIISFSYSFRSLISDALGEGLRLHTIIIIYYIMCMQLLSYWIDTGFNYTIVPSFLYFSLFAASFIISSVCCAVNIYTTHNPILSMNSCAHEDMIHKWGE